MKQIIVFSLLFLFNSCFFANKQILYFHNTFNQLRQTRKVDIRQLIKIKTVYRLKNGQVIDKYKNQYGYWYNVRKGDSLYRVSKRSGTTVRNLARMNGMRINSVLKQKSCLFVPLSESYLKRNAEQINLNLKKKDFIWPINGRKTSGFGLRTWGRRKKFHKGIDLAAPPGTKIMAARAGKVTFAGKQPGYGYVVYIQHNDHYETRYAHLMRVLTKKGDKIEQGQIIGLVGTSGRSTGYHLHFEVRLKKYAVDPIDYLPSKVDKLAKLYNPSYTKN